jgi:hypothetical protein
VALKDREQCLSFRTTNTVPKAWVEEEENDDEKERKVHCMFYTYTVHSDSISLNWQI